MQHEHDMKCFDMEQCHRFLHSWQDTEPVPCTEDEIFGHHTA